jgi:putative restriction endonuclease
MRDRSVDGVAREVALRVASYAPPGDWRSAETTLAMLIAVYADPSKLGGTKRLADGRMRQHPAVLAVAKAIGRSPDAVVFKVMNLRSVLTQGARGFHRVAALDRETVARYVDHFDALLFDAVTIASQLPGAGDVIDAIVPRAIAAGVGRDGSADAVRDDGPEPETERIAEVVRRKGQDVFRGRVLANYAHACAFCGLRSQMPEENSYLLLASHIRPWAASSGHERLDPTNGFSLCATHDRAFEWGFLTVDEGHRVVASRHASRHYAPEDRVRAEILDLHGALLIRPDRHFLAPGDAYLKYHREEIFELRFKRGA